MSIAPLTCFIGLQSCSDEKSTSSETTVEEPVIEVRKETEIEASKKSNAIENYTPHVDNLVVVLKDGEYKINEQVRGRDADYYNCYVVAGRTYTVTLDSDNDRLNMIIFSPDDSKLFNSDVDGQTLTWTGEFKESGNAIIHISLATDASQDSNIASFELSVSQK